MAGFRLRCQAIFGGLTYIKNGDVENACAFSSYVRLQWLRFSQ